MTTEKKNQHYIPKFYLRNFSFRNNGKQIGLYNIENGTYIQRAKLKTQGSKDFFYGKDGVIENILSECEGFFASYIRSIITLKQPPKSHTKDHSTLLLFVAITALRSPVFLNMFMKMSDGTKENLRQLDPNFKGFYDLDDIENHKLVAMMLSMGKEVSNIISDLEMKILVNNTDTAFITSDFPLIRYNQLFENNNHSSSTGFGVVGLQIFIPISDKLSLILYDKNIYRVGNKRDKTLTINNKRDVDSLNVLQFVNCYRNIFFNDKTKEIYIKNLHEKAKRFKRANQGKSELSYLVKEGEDAAEILKQDKNLLVMNATECKTGLSIQGIKIHSKGKFMKNSTTNDLRIHAKKLRHAKRTKANNV